MIVGLLLAPTSITGISGKQLTCEASGRPKPNITWTKGKPGNQGNTGVVQEGQVLTVTNINSTDVSNSQSVIENKL